MTRGDNIRRMLETDEGLADFFIEHGISDSIVFCTNKPECDEKLDSGETVPDDWCRKCLIEWIKEEKKI